MHVGITRDTLGRRKLKMLILSMNVNQNIVRNRVFDYHLWPGWQQMAIENTVSSDY